MNRGCFFWGFNLVQMDKLSRNNWKVTCYWKMGDTASCYSLMLQLFIESNMLWETTQFKQSKHCQLHSFERTTTAVLALEHHWKTKDSLTTWEEPPYQYLCWKCQKKTNLLLSYSFKFCMHWDCRFRLINFHPTHLYTQSHDPFWPRISEGLPGGILCNDSGSALATCSRTLRHTYNRHHHHHHDHHHHDHHHHHFHLHEGSKFITPSEQYVDWGNNIIYISMRDQKSPPPMSNMLIGVITSTISPWGLRGRLYTRKRVRLYTRDRARLYTRKGSSSSNSSI